MPIRCRLAPGPGRAAVRGIATPVLALVLAGGLARRRPGRRYRAARLARRLCRAVRGRGDRRGRPGPGRRRHPVRRQQHAGPRPRRLPARRGRGDPLPGEPRRERDRRRRLVGPRGGRGGRRSGRPRRRRHLVPARPQRPRRSPDPRPCGHDRPGQQRRGRDLLVPAPGDDGSARGRSARPVRGPLRHAPRDRRRPDRGRPGWRAPAPGTGELGPAVAASLGRPGVRVLELRTDRARNVELHREAVAAAVGAIEALDGPSGAGS